MLLPDLGALGCLNWAKGDSEPHVPHGLSSAPQAQQQGCGQAVPLPGRPHGWKTRNPFRKLYFLASRQSCRAGPGLREMDEQRGCQAQRCSTLRRGLRGMVRGSGHERSLSFLPARLTNRLGAEAEENSLAYCSR